MSNTWTDKTNGQKNQTDEENGQKERKNIQGQTGPKQPQGVRVDNNKPKVKSTVFQIENKCAFNSNRRKGKTFDFKKIKFLVFAFHLFNDLKLWMWHGALADLGSDPQPYLFFPSDHISYSPASSRLLLLLSLFFCWILKFFSVSSFECSHN